MPFWNVNDCTLGSEMMNLTRFKGTLHSDRKSTEEAGKTNCNQDCPGAFSTISYALSYSILDDSLMVLSIYFADWV